MFDVTAHYNSVPNGVHIVLLTLHCGVCTLFHYRIWMGRLRWYTVLQASGLGHTLKGLSEVTIGCEVLLRRHSRHWAVGFARAILGVYIHRMFSIDFKL